MEEEVGPRLISIEEDHARFAPTGFATHQSLVGLLERAMLECQQYGQTRLLVDVRALDHPPLSAVDRFELGQAVAEIWDRSLLLAMVARSDQFDPARFAQRVAENRGLFVGAFADDQAALQWLRRPRPPKSP